MSNRYLFLKAAYADVVAARLRQDPTAEGWPETAGAAFDRFAAIDPSAAARAKPYRYLNWILRIYLAQASRGSPILAEDFYKITERLDVFDRHKLRLPVEERDINRYDLSSLRETARALEGTDAVSGKEMKRALREDINRQTTVLYNGPEGMILVPHTRRAASFWGKGTEWCTAADRSQNAFYRYNGEAPLVIFLPADSRQRFQGSRDAELMNERDEEAIDDLPGDLIARLPQKNLILWPFKHPALCQLINSDPQLMREQIENDQVAVDFVSETLQKDEAFMASCWPAEEDFHTALLDLCRDPKGNAEAIKRMMRGHGLSFKDIPEAVWSDKDFVLAVVSVNGWVLKFADPAFKKDADIVMASIQSNGCALEWADPSFMDNKAYRRIAVETTPDAVGILIDRGIYDRDLILSAVSRRGMLLGILPEILCDDDEIVMAAVSSEGAALRYASARLRDSSAIVYRAVQKNAEAIRHASPRFREREQILELAAIEGLVLGLSDFEADRQVVLAAVRQNGLALQYAHPDLWRDPDIVMAAVCQDGEALEFAEPGLRANVDIASAALKNSLDAMEHIPLATLDLIDIETKRAALWAAIENWSPIRWEVMQYAEDLGVYDPELENEVIRRTLDGEQWGVAKDEKYGVLTGNAHIFPCLRARNWWDLKSGEDVARALGEVLREREARAAYAPSRASGASATLSV